MSEENPAVVPTIESGNFHIPVWRSLVAAAAFAAVLAICLVGTNPNTPSQAGVKTELPIWVGNFLGEEQEVTLAEKTILPDDTIFARKLYRSPEGDMVNLQVVLSGGQRRSIHRPEICLPGQGWNVHTGSTIPVELEGGRTMKVMDLDLSRPVTLTNGERAQYRTAFLYWFVGKDMTTPYHWERILKTSYDRVFRNVNHRWAYVVVSAAITGDFNPNGKNEEQTNAMLKEFIRDAVPKFQTAGAGS